MADVHITRQVFGNWNSVYKKKPALCGEKLQTTLYATADESLDEIEERLGRLSPNSELCASCAAKQAIDLLEQQ